MRRLFIALALPLSFGVACHKAKPAQIKIPATPAPIESTEGREIPPEGASSGDLSESQDALEAPAESTPPKAAALDPIFFSFDDASLSQEAMLQLDALGEYLEAHPQEGLVISGHTDERGTEEYNLALSDERARSAKDYLMRLRIDPARITLVPYGEELPRSFGADEESWSKNRRDEFRLVQKTATR